MAYWKARKPEMAHIAAASGFFLFARHGARAAGLPIGKLTFSKTIGLDRLWDIPEIRTPATTDKRIQVSVN